MQFKLIIIFLTLAGSAALAECISYTGRPSLGILTDLSGDSCDDLVDYGERCDCLLSKMPEAVENPKKFLKDSEVKILGNTLERSILNLTSGGVSMLGWLKSVDPVEADRIEQSVRSCDFESLKSKIASESCFSSSPSAAEAILKELGEVEIRLRAGLGQSESNQKTEGVENSCGVALDKDSAASIELDHQTTDFESMIGQMSEELAVSSTLQEAIALKYQKYKVLRDRNGHISLRDFETKLRRNKIFSLANKVPASTLITALEKGDGLRGFWIDSVAEMKLGSRCDQIYQEFVNVACKTREGPLTPVGEGGADLIETVNPDLSRNQIEQVLCRESGTNVRKTRNDISLGVDLVLQPSLLDEGDEGTTGGVKTITSEAIQSSYDSDPIARVEAVLCENNFNGKTDLKSQIVVIKSSLETECSNSSLTKRCSYLGSYLRILEQQNQKLDYVKENKLFAKFKKENPDSPIKSEEEFARSLREPTFAEKVFFPDDGLGGEAQAESSDQASNGKVMMVISNGKGGLTRFQVPKSVVSNTGRDDEERERLEKMIQRSVSESRAASVKSYKDYQLLPPSKKREVDQEFERMDREYQQSKLPQYSPAQMTQIISEQSRIDRGLAPVSSPRTSNIVPQIASAYTPGSARMNETLRDTLNRAVVTKDKVEVKAAPIGSSQLIDRYKLRPSKDGSYELEKVVISGDIEQDISLLVNEGEAPGHMAKIARSSQQQKEGILQYKRLLQSKEDFLISLDSQQDVEIIVRYYRGRGHRAAPFVTGSKDEHYRRNKEKYQALLSQVKKSIREKDFANLANLE